MDLQILFVHQIPGASLEKELIESEHVGLSLIDQDHEELLLICLTSKKYIFLIDPDSAEHVSIFADLLDHPDIVFYSVDGFWDANLLDQTLDVDISFQTDLASFEIDISMTETASKCPPPRKSVSVDYIIDTYKPPMNDYQKLMFKYLESRGNPNLGKLELQTIRDDPLSPSAKAAIRKRAELARALVMKMRGKFLTLRDQDTYDVYTATLRADDEAHRTYQKCGDNSYTAFCRFQTSCPQVPDSQNARIQG